MVFLAWADQTGADYSAFLFSSTLMSFGGCVEPSAAGAPEKPGGTLDRGANPFTFRLDHRRRDKLAR